MSRGRGVCLGLEAPVAGRAGIGNLLPDAFATRTPPASALAPAIPSPACHSLALLQEQGSPLEPVQGSRGPQVFHGDGR